jgi:hypothetical protein
MNKEKLDEMVQAMNELSSAFENFKSVTQGGPASYYFDRMKEYYEGCIKAAKFQVGDRVELKETVTDGWNGRNHFMTKGAKATITEVDYYKSKYRYHIVFDRETWLKDWDDFKKLETPIEVDVKDKHHFCFYQKDLRRVK